MKRGYHCVTSVATTSGYVQGLSRLSKAFAQLAPEVDQLLYSWQPPPHTPDCPYGFKSSAVQHAMNHGYRFILWCDASIVPLLPLDRIWARAERYGLWIANNGWSNYEWTADHAYPLLFNKATLTAEELDTLREYNRRIKHVVGGAFAIDVANPRGLDVARNYHKFATNGSFNGPWWNTNYPAYSLYPPQGGPSAPYHHAGPCGPSDVRGHRHDQTALSVIAHTLSIPLTECPDYFAYFEGKTEKTILAAKGIHLA